MNVAGGGADRRMLLGTAVAGIGLIWVLLGLTFFPGSEAWGYDYQSYVNAAERLNETPFLIRR